MVQVSIVIRPFHMELITIFLNCINKKDFSNNFCSVPTGLLACCLFVWQSVVWLPNHVNVSCSVRMPHCPCGRIWMPWCTVRATLTEDTSSRENIKQNSSRHLECFGLEVSETVNISDGRANRDDFLPEDLWPNFNEMVTKLQECYVHMNDLFVSFLHHHAHLLFFPWPLWLKS